MSRFKDMALADNDRVFLNLDEYGEKRSFTTALLMRIYQSSCPA